jgi:hypothetical protein
VFHERNLISKTNNIPPIDFAIGGVGQPPLQITDRISHRITIHVAMQTELGEQLKIKVECS